MWERHWEPQYATKLVFMSTGILDVCDVKLVLSIWTTDYLPGAALGRRLC